MLINIHTHIQSNSIYEILNKEETIIDTIYSYGLGPWALEQISEKYFENPNNSLEFEKIIKHKNCVAIGEIGIDKNLSIDLNKQTQLLTKQIFISEKNQLPIILHCVKSWNEIVEIRNILKPTQPWIFHGFRKTELLESVLKSGVHISIGTAIIWDKKLQDSIKNIPIDRLFLETDNNLNYTIMDVYAKICSLKNISLQTLEEQLYKNTKNTFTKWEIG